MSRDRIHVKAPKNWINDPNGFIYYKGIYHLFYQHFPYAPQWGTMHWGHAVSKDLVNWEHQGIALYPTKYEDQNGCFSGSAVEYEDRMYLFYTGVHYLKPDPENIHCCLDHQMESAQLMISSEDGMQFDNLQGKQAVIPVIRDPKIGDRTDTRDPKVWRGTDAWYLVLGSNSGQGNGKLLFYKSENLTDWSFVNSAEKGTEFGYMWECPDYFETDGQQVLVLSPMGILKDGKREENQTICMTVKFDESTCSMKIPDEYQFLDYGLDLYAPQSTLDAEGRRILTAWLRMPEAVDGTWSGMFCIPRVVEVENGHIYFRVHPNIENLFTRKIDSAEEAGTDGYKISADIRDGEKINVGGYRISRKGNQIVTDRTDVFPANEEYRMQFSSPEMKDGNHLDVYVDQNMIEVYINKGEYVISNYVCGLHDEIRTDCAGGIQIYTTEAV